MAVCGHNGNNETLIGNSNSVGLALFDENNYELDISGMKSSPISIYIPRDQNLPEYSFQSVNATQIQLEHGSFYLPCSFRLKALNSSIHIELKPIDSSLGYVVVLKFDQTPIVNSTYAYYDAFKILCPSKMLWKN